MPVTPSLLNVKADTSTRLENLEITGTLEVDGVLTASAGILEAVTVTADDGAVTITPSTVVITKAGVCALTLGTPTAAQNGTVIRFVSTTANAHTVTAATIGFNAGNAGADVATFGGAIGDGFAVLAYGGEWYIISNINVTLA